MSTEEDDQIQLLTSTDDDYSGVIVELMDHPIMDSTTFLSILRPSISNWKQQVILYANLQSETILFQIYIKISHLTYLASKKVKPIVFELFRKLNMFLKGEQH